MCQKIKRQKKKKIEKITLLLLVNRLFPQTQTK